MSPRKKSERRLATEQRLIDAVGEVISEGGVESLGVNAVAARAGVDKVLIYRYFGNLEGLLREWASTMDFWPTTDELLGADREVLDLPPARLASTILRRHVDGLMRRPVTRELLAWECVHRGPLTAILEEIRETQTMAMYQEMAERGVQLGGGVAELGAVFGAALNYLAIRTRFIRLWSGIDLHTEEGWDRMQSAIEKVFELMTAADN